MKQRHFGSTSDQVSEVGLGTWQLGGTEWGNITDATALEVLQTAFDHGTRFFDTADIYGGGRSESLIGQFLKKLGPDAKEVKVASKLGRRFDTPNGWPQNFTMEGMRRHTQESLRRLGIEQLFLQQFHCIPFEILKEDIVFENMRTLQKEGLIKHWGVSVETVEEGLYCINQPGCGALQVIFNIVRQKLCTELLPQAQAKGVAILARVPLASGLLSGTYRSGQSFVSTDHRHFNANGEKFNVGETFAGVPLEQGIALAEKIKAILKPTEQISMATLALRWVLDHPAVTTVIPGATKAKQIITNNAASSVGPLSEAVHRELRKLYDSEIHGIVRGRY